MIAGAANEYTRAARPWGYFSFLGGSGNQCTPIILPSPCILIS